VKILGLSGSLRSESHNTALLRAAGELLPAGIALELWDGLKAIPPYDEDDDVEGAPAGVAALKAAISGADGILIATPEYNHSVPGQLKNALDWVSRPFAGNPLQGKPTTVVGASTGIFGAVWAQAELRKVLRAIGAHLVGEELPVGQAPTRFDEGGRLVDEEIRRQLAERIEALVAAVRASKAPLTADLVAA
jgi:chromate reductase, NAD(P)H dehydrogenase (quinone)